MVIAIGTALSLITFACEYYYYRIRPKHQGQAYKFGESNTLSRLESEISLDSVQVRQTSEMELPSHSVDFDKSRDRSSNRETKSNGLKAKSNSFHLSSLSPKKNLFKRKTKSSNSGCSKNSKDISNTNGFIPHANGHALNGIGHSIFTYENTEFDSRAELFPGIQEEPTGNTVFSEKL